MFYTLYPKLRKNHTGSSHILSFLFDREQVIRKLLRCTAGKSATAHLETVRLVADLLISHNLRSDARASRESHCHLVEPFLVRLRVEDRKAKPVDQGAVSYTHLTLPTILRV